MKNNPFKALFESAPVAVVEGHWDRSFKVLNANPAAISLFKARDAKQFKNGFNRLLLNIPSKIFLDLLSVRLKGGIFESEFRLPTFRNKFIYVWIRLASIAGADRDPRVVLVFNDITRRKGQERFLRKLAHVDGLTGVFNQRTILKRLDEELARAKRYELKLSCIIFDLDLFKNVNDTFGHLSGDRCLRKAARLLKDSLRKTDIIGRYGGDEFLVILPETAPQQAVIPVERFLKFYADHSVVRSKDRSVHTSFSVGISGYSAKDVDSVKGLINAADKALYLSKTSGGNRVNIAGVEK
jgi:diguanylate cyclase (GGDEF)-like protein